MFHMLPHSYRFSHGLYLNNFLQVWFIDNQRDRVHPFRYINRYYGMSRLVRERKVLVDMKYSILSVKQEAEAIVIWTEEYWDVKRVNLLYTMLSRRFNFKINKRFDSLSFSSIVKDVYKGRGYIIGELNE